MNFSRSATAKAPIVGVIAPNSWPALHVEFSFGPHDGEPFNKTDELEIGSRDRKLMAR